MKYVFVNEPIKVNGVEFSYKDEKGSPENKKVTEFYSSRGDLDVMEQVNPHVLEVGDGVRFLVPGLREVLDNVIIVTVRFCGAITGKQVIKTERNRVPYFGKSCHKRSVTI